MRKLAVLLIIAALIYFGWDKPFKIWVDDAWRMLPGKQTTEVAPQNVVPAQPTPTPAPRIIPGIVRQPTPPSDAWMWNATHRGALERPTPSPTRRP
jgi:hypothetical protein